MSKNYRIPFSQIDGSLLQWVLYRKEKDNINVEWTFIKMGSNYSIKPYRE